MAEIDKRITKRRYYEDEAFVEQEVTVPEDTFQHKKVKQM